MVEEGPICPIHGDQFISGCEGKLVYLVLH
jgi:hypothetical protein